MSASPCALAPMAASIRQDICASTALARILKLPPQRVKYGAPSMRDQPSMHRPAHARCNPYHTTRIKTDAREKGCRTALQRAVCHSVAKPQVAAVRSRIIQAVARRAEAATKIDRDRHIRKITHADLHATSFHAHSCTRCPPWHLMPPSPSVWRTETAGVETGRLARALTQHDFCHRLVGRNGHALLQLLHIVKGGLMRQCGCAAGSQLPCRAGAANRGAPSQSEASTKTARKPDGMLRRRLAFSATRLTQQKML